MSSITVSLIVFACVFGGALLGVLLRVSLPKGNLSPESRDVVKLAMGTIATMTAVILGLLVASAKGYYDNQSRELTEMSARVVVLDRILAHYGPEAKDARDQLRETVVHLLSKIWVEPSSKASKTEPSAAGEVIFDKIQGLSPQNDSQRSLQARALNLAIEIGETRWLMFEQASTSISKPMLLVVIFSLTITFTSFSLHAAPNPTVIITLILCALAVASTLFLILEMYQPFQGLIQISSDPLRNALAHLGQ
jgi:hypothetical protein